MNNKALHISHTDIRYDPRILKEISSLSEIEFIEIFTIGISNSNKYEKNKKNNITKFSIKLLSRKFRFPFKSILYTLNLFEFGLKIILIGVKIKPDVIHCHDTLALMPAVLLKFIVKSKLIYDAHELESQTNMQTFLLSKSTLLIEKMCWKYIDVFISVSDSIINWYIKKFGVKKKELILNTPITRNIISKKGKENDLRKIFKIKKDKIIFIYVGDFCEGRGINLTLDVFSNKEINSDVVFLGDGVLKNKILSYSANYKNIHFHPLVPHHEVVNLIKSSDVGICFIENVSLSDYFCLPNKLFEYLFAGLNILGSNIPEIAKFITTNKVGTVCDLKPNDFKNKIKYYEKNGAKKHNIDLNAFSWESQSKKIKKLYKELLN